MTNTNNNFEIREMKGEVQNESEAVFHATGACLPSDGVTVEVYRGAQGWCYRIDDNDPSRSLDQRHKGVFDWKEGMTPRDYAVKAVETVTNNTPAPIFGHDDDAWDQSVFHPVIDQIAMLSQLAKELEDGRRGTFLKESWNSGQSEFYVNDVLDAIEHMTRDLECAKAQVETYLELAECDGERVRA